MADRRKHLDTLGLTSSASEGDIKKAYKQLALKYHPDKNDSHDAKSKFQEISFAYKYLTDGPEGMAGVDPREDMMAHFFQQMFEDMFYSPFGRSGFHPFMFAHQHRQPHFFVYDSDEEYYIDTDDDDDDEYYTPPRHQGRDTKKAEPKQSNTQPAPNPYPETKSSRKREKRLRQKARRKEHQEGQKLRDLRQRMEEQQRQEERQKQRSRTSMYTDDIQDGSPPGQGTEETDQPASSASKKAEPPKLTKEQQREKQIAEQKRRDEEMQTIREELLAQQEQEQEKKREKERKRAEKEKQQAEKEKEEQEAKELLNWFDNGKMSKKARKREKKLQEEKKLEEEKKLQEEKLEEEKRLEEEKELLEKKKLQEAAAAAKAANQKEKVKRDTFPRDYHHSEIPEVKPLPDKGKPRPVSQSNPKNKSKFKGPDQFSVGRGQNHFEQGYSNGGFPEETDVNGYPNEYGGHGWDEFQDYGYGNPYGGRGGGRGGGFHGNRGGFNHYPNNFPPQGYGHFPRPPPPPPHFGMHPPRQQFDGRYHGPDPARNGYQSYPVRPPLYNVPPPYFHNVRAPGFPPMAYEGRNLFYEHQQNGHNQRRPPHNNHNQHSQKQTTCENNSQNQTTRENNSQNQSKPVTKQQSKPYSSGRTFYNTNGDAHNGFQPNDNSNTKNSSQFDRGGHCDEKVPGRRNFYDEISANASPEDVSNGVDDLADTFSSNAHIDPSSSRPFVNKNHAGLADNYKGSNSSLDSLDEFSLPSKCIFGSGLKNESNGQSVSSPGTKTFVNKNFHHPVSAVPIESNGSLDSLDDFAIPTQVGGTYISNQVGDIPRGSNAALDSFDDFSVPRNVGNAHVPKFNMPNDGKEYVSVPDSMGDGRSSVPEYMNEVMIDDDNDDEVSDCSLDSLDDGYGNSTGCYGNVKSDPAVKEVGSSERFTDLYAGYEGKLTSQHLNVPEGMRSSNIANYYK